jgi:hypothetical protein
MLTDKMLKAAPLAIAVVAVGAPYQRQQRASGESVTSDGGSERRSGRTQSTSYGETNGSQNCAAHPSASSLSALYPGEAF